MRCYRVAAKYWEHDNEGRWIAPNRSTTLTIGEILGDSTRVRKMVAAQVCRCDPPPTLPDGEELAALVTRARRKLPPELVALTLAFLVEQVDAGNHPCARVNEIRAVA